MFRKLVKLDPTNGGSFSEVDLIRLRRAAVNLKTYLNKLNPAEDDFDILGQVGPLVDAVLDGTAKLPYLYADYPLSYPVMEGMVPQEFVSLYASFKLAASSGMLEKPNIVVISGDEYAEMELEEPGDWPEVVKRREEERRIALEKEFE